MGQLNSKFIINKYTMWYSNIINNSKYRKLTGYKERHHIIPKAMGGSNALDNIAILTAREHFICHLLLVKMVDGHYRKLMEFAVGKFIQVSPKQNRKFTSWEYSKIRKTISSARTGTRHSKETCEKISQNAKGRVPWNKGISGTPSSDNKKRLLSEFWKGKCKTDSHKAGISKGKLGHTAGMTGKTHSDTTKLLMSQNMRKPKGPQQRVNVCPVCSKSEVTHRHIKFCKD